MRAGTRFDVIVIGAGVVGSSIAMALAERSIRTLAVDIDLSGRLSSSEKNAGGSLTIKDGVKSVFLVPTDYSPTK